MFKIIFNIQQASGRTLPQVERMVTTEVREFTRWLSARATFPGLKTLREQAAAVAEGELQWALTKLPDLLARAGHCPSTLSKL